jgi:transglutaminase-like putative cysteine protease
VVPDPEHAEFVRSPDVQLQTFACYGVLGGDCDDSATLAASLLYQLGVDCSLIAIRTGFDPDFSHVFTRAFFVDGFLDIDPIVDVSLLPLQNFVEKMELPV